MQILIFLSLFAVVFAKKWERTSSRTENSSINDYVNSDGRRVKSYKPVVATNYGKEVSYSVIGPVQDYDRVFVQDWWRFMRQLWSADGKGRNGIKQEMPSSALEFLPRETEKPLRMNQNVAFWKPVNCKNLGFRLQHVKTIQNNEKNLVVLMRDSESDKQFIYKTFSSPEAYTNELVFSQFVRPGNSYLVPAVCFSQEKDDDEKRPALVYQYVEGKQSLDYARLATLDELQRISAELMVAIRQMHFMGYIHADLKPHNVIISKTGRVQVIDFGFSCPIENGKRHQGTHFTMAPELYKKVPGLVHEGVDWWAYGSTVAMWYGAYYDEQEYRRANKGKPSGRKGSRHTFIPMNWKTEKNKFLVGEVPEAFPSQLRSFLFHFFHIDPDTRIYNTKRLYEGLRNHPLFEGVNWAEIDPSLAA